MALTKEKKQEVIKSIQDVISKASAMTFVNFHGLKVEDASDMRSKLRQEGVSYVVAKKTLVKKAFEGSDITGDMPVLEGELGIAYTEGDMTAPAREIYDFQKKLGDTVSIVGGVFEGQFVDKTKMTEIAEIPSFHTLQAQFVNLINSPIQGLAVALNAIAESKEQ